MEFMLYSNQTSAGLRSLKLLFWSLVVVLYFSGPAYSQSRFIRNWANLKISHLNAPLLMSPLPDSGWVVVSMPNSKDEVLLTRYRNCGDILWEKSFHDPDILHPASISFSDEKNSILLTFQTENSSLQKGIYLLVIGLTGTPELAIHLLGSQDIYVKSAGFLENGNYFIGGVEGVGASFPFLMVLNENGDILWSKKKQSIVVSVMSAIPVSDGGILSCGENTITKWNSLGAVEFQATVTASYGQFDLGTTTPLEYDDGFILATAFYHTNSCNLLKINMSGIHEWFSPSFPIIAGGTFSQLHKLSPTRICADADNKIVIAGTVNVGTSTLGTRIHKFSALGTPLYSNTFSFSENLYCYDFSILKSGEGLMLNIHQNRNPILLKTNPYLEIGCHEAPNDSPFINVGPIIQTTPCTITFFG